ncbi:MAG: bifunctional diaminohydroxyphosphoribosylaminopyrimidine deaminase/5-amino-6-(5-phosphoribosylamino)uracil reductase RibD [Candidatus Eisenbacteria bacterium]
MARTTDDSVHMRRALRLAERGRGRTAPNPMVGAVVVRDGRVVAEGWHKALGEPHAEIMALERAGALAKGATLYCTLEPCAHFGRTPPCADAVIAAGVKRCVVAIRDPNRVVDGQGMQKMRAAGVRIELGLHEEEARAQLRSYLLVHTRHRPSVTWKVAATLDGRIADAKGGSRWITSAAARQRGHQMRAACDAVMIGAGTARIDDPRLTVRLAPAAARQPLRVVCDSQLSLPSSLRLFSRSLARGTVVACAKDAPARRVASLESRGVRVWKLPSVMGRVSPRALARRLALHGVLDVLLEGGAMLGAAWLRASLVDRIALFTAPRVLGAGLSWCAPIGATLANARKGRVVSVERVGGDTLTWVEWED